MNQKRGLMCVLVIFLLSVSSTVAAEFTHPDANTAKYSSFIIGAVNRADFIKIAGCNDPDNDGPIAVSCGQEEANSLGFDLFCRFSTTSAKIDLFGDESGDECASDFNSGGNDETGNPKLPANYG